MPNTTHWAIFIDNSSQKEQFIQHILQGKSDPLLLLPQGHKGALFSKLALYDFMEEEDRHDHKALTGNTHQALKTMSSGEQKKALLQYLLASNPDFLILDNPYDNLDVASQKKLETQLTELSSQLPMLQLISRKADRLTFINQHFYLSGSELRPILDPNNPFPGLVGNPWLEQAVPPPLQAPEAIEGPLISMEGVTVRYGEKTIIKDIHWQILAGDFWQLVGPNGSGKTTMLTMITGDNPKAYGQELYLFGNKKGSGESVWDLKKKIGYFTPSMTDKFEGFHYVKNMIISGLLDSIGLYKKPNDTQMALADQWLALLGMEHLAQAYFSDLSMGQQRLVMLARAMVKHPPLLILDEPTAGLDDASAQLFVQLVNRIAQESTTAIVFVSHRTEPGLEPHKILELLPSANGSTAMVKDLN